MKQILVMIAVVVLVGCGEDTRKAAPLPAPVPVPPVGEKLIADPDIEKMVRTHINKSKGQLTEADLAKVTGIRNATQITDEGLKDVAKLHNLKSLSLDRSNITDAGLKEVAKLQNLKYLSLDNTRITDAGLKEVAKLQNLKWLMLDRTNITDAGLKEVAKLQELVQLYLYHTKITYEGLAELKKAMPNCEIRGNPTPPPMNEKLIVEKAIRNGLRMPEGDLTDADLERVTHLFFGAVNLTEDGLRELVRLDKLELLHFERSQITDKGLKEVALKVADAKLP